MHTSRKHVIYIDKMKLALANHIVLFGQCKTQVTIYAVLAFHENISNIACEIIYTISTTHVHMGLE